MGFILFLIAVIFISLFILIIYLSSKSNSTPYFYNDDSHDYDDYDDFSDDLDPPHKTPSSHSSFAYPNPYDLPPEQSMFLGDDGDLLEDL